MQHHSKTGMLMLSKTETYGLAKRPIGAVLTAPLDNRLTCSVKLVRITEKYREK